MTSDYMKYLKEHMPKCSNCVFRGCCYPRHCAALSYWMRSYKAMDYIV